MCLDRPFVLNFFLPLGRKLARLFFDSCGGIPSSLSSISRRILLSKGDNGPLLGGSLIAFLNHPVDHDACLEIEPNQSLDSLIRYPSGDSAHEDIMVYPFSLILSTVFRILVIRNFRHFSRRP